VFDEASDFAPSFADQAEDDDVGFGAPAVSSASIARTPVPIGW
jgi:hypothetical protein